jgi:hypothetical protein
MNKATRLPNAEVVSGGNYGLSRGGCRTACQPAKQGVQVLAFYARLFGDCISKIGDGSSSDKPIGVCGLECQSIRGFDHLEIAVTLYGKWDAVGTRDSKFLPPKIKRRSLDSSSRCGAIWTETTHRVAIGFSRGACRTHTGAEDHASRDPFLQDSQQFGR